MRIVTVNNWYKVTDRANITVAIIQKVYGILNGTFLFDLGTSNGHHTFVNTRSFPARQSVRVFFLKNAKFVGVSQKAITS